MRKILQRLLSKLFIVSTIIIIQMIWWFFLFYTASVASRVFQDLLYVAAILLSLYIVNRRMKMYIKMSWIFLILSVPIVGIPCYFFFGRPELTSKTQKRMARIVEAYAPLRPENELLNETLRLTDMDAYRQSRLITQNQKYPLYAEDCTEYFKSGEEAFESILKDLRSAPVGYMDELDMYPLDFEEFIKASGVKTETIDYLKKCFLERLPVTDVINNKMLTHLKRYLVIGGMPAAVSTYVETGNVGEVSIIQDNIIRQYKVDFTKYEAEDKKLMLTAIFDQIPSQLLRQNKRFNYSDIQKKLRFKKLEDSFLWLKYAGVAIATINATEPRIALSQNAKSSLIKLYSSDVGLLTYQYGNALRAKVLFGEEKINLGGVYENFVAQELNAHGYPSYFYNNHNLGELDFVIEHEGSVLPIEVKSGKDYYVHSAISKAAYNDEYQVKEAYVFANCNIEVRDKIVYYPIYMCAFVSDEFEYPVLSLDI